MKPTRRCSSSGLYRTGCPSISLGKEMYWAWAFSTRHGLWRISSVGSGSGSFFFSSPSPSFFSLPSLSLLLSLSFSLSLSLSLSFDGEELPAEPAASADALDSASALAADLAPSAGASSTSIICSLARSLAATDSVAAEPTTVVPGVAATDMASPLFVKAPSTTELLTETLSSMSTSASVFSFSLLFNSSAAFFSRSALALAAVERTAAAVLACSSFFGGCSGSG
mmetsp:Transcript_35412/g.110399  ORF Transcript_35412/g.110399 Transcript_35412/m.110399 type:complete len:225 (-) Transcript_35412:1520-2194(-)